MWHSHFFNQICWCSFSFPPLIQLHLFMPLSLCCGAGWVGSSSRMLRVICCMSTEIWVELSYMSIVCLHSSSWHHAVSGLNWNSTQLHRDKFCSTVSTSFECSHFRISSTNSDSEGRTSTLQHCNGDTIFILKFLILEVDSKSMRNFDPWSHKNGAAWSLIPKKTADPDPMACDPWSHPLDPWSHIPCYDPDSTCTWLDSSTPGPAETLMPILLIL